MSWYYILCFCSIGIFLLKGLASYLIGAFDADIDGALSDVFSLKGLLHFCIGFSTFLSVLSYGQTNSLYVLTNFTTMNYVWAFVCGLIFSVSLFLLYKFVMKANTYNEIEVNFDGVEGRVTLVDEENRICRVNISTALGVREIDARETNKEVMHSIGDFVTLKYNKEENNYSI